ncbi:proliferating cell nuclear antigen, N-terminal domain-containing protein [Sparassis latifolia]
MLEARLSEAVVLKRAFKELRADNIACRYSENAITLQAFDKPRVVLVIVRLAASAFERYLCDRRRTLRVKLDLLTKVLQCAKYDDAVTIKADDHIDFITLTYQARDSGRVEHYNLVSIDIPSDTFFPDTRFLVRATTPSAEFARVARNLSRLSDTVCIEISKRGVRFRTCSSSISCSVFLPQADPALSPPMEEPANTQQDVQDEHRDEEEEFGEKDEDGDVMMNGHDPTKEAGKGPCDANDVAANGVSVEVYGTIALTIGLKYLLSFVKSTERSNAAVVQLRMDDKSPLLGSPPPFLPVPCSPLVILSFFLPPAANDRAYCRFRMISITASSDTILHP